jgi:hypothetical protein
LTVTAGVLLPLPAAFQDSFPDFSSSILR